MDDEDREMVELPDRLRGSLVGVIEFPADGVADVYLPVEEFEQVVVDGRSLVLFGTTGLSGTLLLDVRSGSVVFRVQGSLQLGVVNSSVDAFNRCLEVFSEKLEALDEGITEDEDELDALNNRIAREMEKEFRRIDGGFYSEQNFWYELRWGVANGDFSG
ncbi:SUKH-4 family immunity protein [Streptomyces sp. NPDC091281]|uniref:SUKH-4 family immunity protein n=1 Tax=Streptomyces sp. NPDC091281 TaxID=3365985 RepID=UPI0037F56F3E